MKIMNTLILSAILIILNSCVTDRENENNVNKLITDLNPSDQHSVEVFHSEIAEYNENIVPLLLNSCNDSWNQSKNEIIIEAALNISKTDKVFDLLLEFVVDIGEYSEGVAVYFLSRLLYNIKDNERTIEPPSEILTIYINAITNSNRLQFEITNSDYPTKINEISSFQLLTWTEFRDRDLEKLILPSNVDIVSTAQALRLKEELNKWYNSRSFKWNKKRKSFGTLKN